MKIDLHWRRNLRKPRPHISTQTYLPPWARGLPRLDSARFLRGIRDEQFTIVARPPSYVDTPRTARIQSAVDHRMRQGGRYVIDPETQQPKYSATAHREIERDEA